MKNILRVICITLVVLLVSGACCALLPASATTGEGLSFEENDLYQCTKTYEEAPNTFEAWIKLPTDARQKNAGSIFSNNGMGNQVIDFNIHKGGYPRLKIIESENKSAEWIFNQVNVCTNKWTHVTIVKNNEKAVVECYVNGELKQSLPIEGDACSSDIIPASGGLDVGVGFVGAIREAALFSTARTPEEINADMTSPLGQNGLMSYYDFSKSSPKQTVKDLSENGHDLRYVYNPDWIEVSEKEKVTNYAYSFAIIGDTQKINIKYPEKFNVIYDWILNNIDRKNIKFVFGLGDITDTSSQAEWDRAYEAIHSLDGKVDYSIVRGNHDKTNDFVKTFPWSDYENSFDGHFGMGVLNTYKTLEIGDVKYLLITLDFGPSDKSLEWAGELCEQYSDHRVIITTHAYLYCNGYPLDADDHAPPVGDGGYNNGDHMWDKFVSKYENIQLIISGHEATSRVVVSQRKGDHGNTVTQMLVNPQLLDLNNSGGFGMVAMLYFSEDGRNVTVEYYSTIRKKFYKGVNQFSFSLYPEDDEVAEETLPEETEPMGDTVASNGGSCSSTVSLGAGVTISIMIGAALLTARKKEEK